MEENVLNNTNEVSVNEVSSTEENYIDALNTLKRNSVDKTEYDKVVQENKRLVDTLIANGQIENPVEDIPVDIDGLRKELFGKRPKDMSNLEYCTKAISLRDAILERDNVDIFLPNANSYQPTFDDITTANRVADTMKHCIEYANGDSQVFTNELMRLTKDAAPQRGGRR